MLRSSAASSSRRALLLCLATVTLACSSAPEPRDLGATTADFGAADVGPRDDIDAGNDLDAGMDGGARRDVGVDAGLAPLTLVCGRAVPVEMDDADGYGFPILSVLADGRAAVSYHRVSATPRFVGVSSFDPATGTWTELPGPPLGAVSRTAVTRHGDDVWSLWYEPSGSYFRRRFDAGADEWSAVESFTARLLTEPIGATGRSGHLFAVTTDGPATAELTARRLPPGATEFDVPVALDDEGLVPARPAVAVDPAGQALVLWQRDRGADWEFVLQVFDGTAWLTDGGGPAPLIVADPGRLVGGSDFDVAVTDRGESGLVAYRVGSGALVIETRTVDLTADPPTFGAVETITPTGAASTVRTALTPSGDAIVVWVESVGAGGNAQLRWVTRTGGGVWSAEVEDDDALTARSWDVAATASGFVLAAATGDRMVLRRIRPGGEGGAWVDIGLDANGASAPTLAAEADGTMHAVFSQLDEGAARSSILHARCD